MFLREYREEEEGKRNMHATYTNKPIPTLQLASQVSKFDNGEIKSARSDITPLPVPTTWDTYYDPNHPDADWSGLVSLKNNQKKHHSSSW
jgi:flagellar basal body rod protein FlgC